MSVYFAAAGGYVKVGYSTNVIQRMWSLSGSDYTKRPADLPRAAKIELIGWFPGTKRDELLAHAALNDHWVDGEWYRDNATVRSYLTDQPEAILVAELSARALFAVLDGVPRDEAKALYPLGCEAA
jgi:hypothetical protein